MLSALLESGIGAGLQLLGAGISGLLGEDTSENTKKDINKLYDEASKKIEDNYNKVLNQIKTEQDAYVKKLTDMFPQYADKIKQLYKVEENPYFQKLQQNLAQQKEYLKQELYKAKTKGKTQFMQALGRIGSYGGRASSQLAKYENKYQENLAKMLNQQDIAQNQMRANLLNQWGLTGANAQANILGQQQAMLNNAYSMIPKYTAMLGQQEAGILSSNARQKANTLAQYTVQNPEQNGWNFLGAQLSNLGGALTGRGVGRYGEMPTDNYSNLKNMLGI